MESTPDLSRRKLLKWAGAGAIAGVVGVGLGDVGTNWLQVSHHELRLPRWYADGVRIALIADLHANDLNRKALADRAIELALAEHPDIIFFAGDFLTVGDPKRLKMLEDTLGRCQGVPAFGVLGNHDYWTGYPGEIAHTIARTPVTLLSNQATSVHDLAIFGVDDGIAGRPRYDLPDLGTDAIVVLHEPDYVERLHGHRSALQLSGHSHGGQICWPDGSPIHLPMGAQKYWGGFYPQAPTPLFVTRGTGTTGPHWRMFCRPEVAILTIRQA